MSPVGLLHVLQLNVIPGPGWVLKIIMIIPTQNSFLRLKDFAVVVHTTVRLPNVEGGGQGGCETYK